MTSTSVPKKRISLIVSYELAVTPLPPKIICSIKKLYSQFILQFERNYNTILVSHTSLNKAVSRFSNVPIHLYVYIYILCCRCLKRKACGGDGIIDRYRGADRVPLRTYGSQCNGYIPAGKHTETGELYMQDKWGLSEW